MLAVVVVLGLFVGGCVVNEGKTGVNDGNSPIEITDGSGSGGGSGNNDSISENDSAFTPWVK